MVWLAGVNGLAIIFSQSQGSAKGVIVVRDSPGVFSHAAVRARNCQITVAACPR